MEQSTIKKYELVNEDTIVLGDVTLFRVKALISFGAVKKGDLGGYVENEDNLSHSGYAWVSDGAVVYDNAKVTGDAWVIDNARIYGKAKVTGNARVFGTARVSGDATVAGDAIVYGR